MGDASVTCLMEILQRHTEAATIFVYKDLNFLFHLAILSSS